MQGKQAADENGIGNKNVNILKIRVNDCFLKITVSGIKWIKRDNK